MQWVLIFVFSGDGCEAGYGLLSLYEDSFMTGISLNYVCCESRWFWLIFVWLIELSHFTLVLLSPLQERERERERERD